MEQATKKKTYMNPYLAGVLLGLVLLASFVVTGHGVGASGGLARLLAGGLDLVASSHVDRTADWAELAGGARNPYNHWLVWGILGTIAGGFVSGLLGGRIKLETYRGPRLSSGRRWLMAFLGGILVGFGARLARGCTSGQALSGGAVLSVGSWAFMLAVFAGGYLLAIPVRKLWN